MKIQPTNYVPRKNKIQWKGVLVSFVVVMLIFTGLDFALKYERKERVNLYGICGVNDKQTRELLDESVSEQTLEIRDYLFYGETLNLYQQPYSLTERDPMIGKTIILKDLCSQDDFMYILEGTVDGQIPLEDLEPGFYMVSLLQDTRSYQLYSNNPIEETFYTVSRFGTHHKITLRADQTMFNNPEDTENYLQRAYLYIEVTEETAPSSIVDIVLDPGHFSYDNGSYLEVGNRVKERTEAEETYRFAVVLKEKLEALGLRVLITRSSNTDIVNSYGLEGRLHKGYQAQAKYYLDIQMMSAANPSTRGTQVIYSSYSSNRLASTVYNSLIEDTSLITTGNGKNPGILASGRLNDYDGRMMIRESGGRILAAGTFSEKAESENGSFAKDSRFGMQALTLEYAYLSNSEDMAVWDSEMELIAEKTAEGFARYLRIEK